MMDLRGLLKDLVDRCRRDKDDRRPARLPGARTQPEVGGAVSSSALDLDRTVCSNVYRPLEVERRVGVQIYDCRSEVLIVFLIFVDVRTVHELVLGVYCLEV